jgi:hypothetical protein
LTAALLLASRSALRRLGLPHPGVGQILEATGASRSRAYELMAALLALVPTLSRAAGRPRAEPAAVPIDVSPLADQVLHFVMQHPGCVHQHGQRQRYSDAFRCFVLQLCQNNPQLPLDCLARAVHVPEGTLKDWLRGGRTDTDGPATGGATTTKTDPVATGRIETIIEQWRSWKGTFTAFCEHISFNLRIPFGRSLIASILEQNGERTPKRRKGRSPDEKALRGAFETFFPGAQWQGDGTAIEVRIDEQRFGFNLELMVDAHSDAFVGVSFRDQEDSAAVIEAFDDGVNTTGAPPLCTLLDNRPSNHTPEVEQALQPSLCMHATKGRAQNKAHVEGGFGLFVQTVPALAIVTSSPREVARQLLQLVTVTFARTLNRKPRRDRKGRCRADIYQQDMPTPEQVEQARAALQERIKQQQKARETQQRRQDPVVRAMLDDAFARLGLDDPQGNIRAAIARYRLDAVTNGIATFEGKRRAGTLPETADGRYLLGIVRNISQQDEGLQITEALLFARLKARDLLLQPLQNDLDCLLNAHDDPAALLSSLIDRTTTSERMIDRLFWLGAAADTINNQPLDQHSKMLRLACKRILAVFALPYTERLRAVRFITSKVIPLQ